MINQNRLVQTLLSLVKIDSPSGEEEAVAKEMAKRIKLLGGEVEFDTYGNLIAKFKGEGEPILLNTHMDTVEPGRGIKPQVQGDRITSDGTTVLGGDPKVGLAILLEMIASFKEDDSHHLPFEIVLTRQEETGLCGALNLDYSKVSAKEGIVLDGDEEVHKVFVSAPGYYRLDATIIGRSAHAGVEPEKGISAIEVAANIISKMKLGRLDHETSANIGLISGGSARNAVPERVELKGEIRSRTQAKLLRQAAKVQKIFEKVLSLYPDAKLELDMKLEFEGFKLPPTHKAVMLACGILREMNLEPMLIDSGGGSDANIFHAHGIEVVVVGNGVWEPHTTREYVIIPQMLQAAQFVHKLLTTNNQVKENGR